MRVRKRELSWVAEAEIRPQGSRWSVLAKDTCYNSRERTSPKSYMRPLTTVRLISKPFFFKNFVKTWRYSKTTGSSFDRYSRRVSGLFNSSLFHCDKGGQLDPPLFKQKQHYFMVLHSTFVRSSCVLHLSSVVLSGLLDLNNITTKEKDLWSVSFRCVWLEITA